MTSVTLCKICGTKTIKKNLCSDCKVVEILREDIINSRVDEYFEIQGHQHEGSIR